MPSTTWSFDGLVITTRENCYRYTDVNADPPCQYDLPVECDGSNQPVGAGSRCRSCRRSFGFPHPANLIVGKPAPVHHMDAAVQQCGEPADTAVYDERWGTTGMLCSKHGLASISDIMKSEDAVHIDGCIKIITEA